MAFYEQISRYYDYIFPVGQEQLDFIKVSAGLPPRRILDVACGSGGYSVELSKQGYIMSALDFDREMVRLAKDKAYNERLDIKVLQGDMKKLQEYFPEKFDGIFCIGNSIVHLGSHDEIEKALVQMHELLEDSGKLVLQVINYDRIIKYGVNELPPIENEDIGLKFIRKYAFDNENGIINFNTVLSVDGSRGNEKYENSIQLIPLISGQMERLLKNAGFERFTFFGDFKRSAYTDNSYMLVVEAEK